MAPRIAVVGSINADLVVQMPSLPLRGETVRSSEPLWFPGGKGANQAVAAARMGGQVTMYGAVGQDAPGEMCLASLLESGVDISAIAKVSSATSTALVMVEHSGENQIVVTDGANQHVTFDPAAVAQADAVIVQFEIPEDVLIQAGKSSTGIFCVNAAPVREMSNELAELIDVLIVNEIEFTQLGKPSGGLVIVTAGANEVIAYQDGEIVAKCTPPKVAAIDTVGAGDTFVGAFIVAFASGADVSTSLHRACAASALSTLKLGAQSGMPTASQVEAFLQTYV
ncbi:MAG: ribokinase [Candidatus Nanopelagicales bacterium]|nr:ribokinase [Candidatus Nanopelagicales bacterium]